MRTKTTRRPTISIGFRSSSPTRSGRFARWSRCKRAKSRVRAPRRRRRSAIHEGAGDEVSAEEGGSLTAEASFIRRLRRRRRLHRPAVEEGAEHRARTDRHARPITSTSADRPTRTTLRTRMMSTTAITSPLGEEEAAEEVEDEAEEDGSSKCCHTCLLV